MSNEKNNAAKMTDRELNDAGWTLASSVYSFVFRADMQFWTHADGRKLNRMVQE
jgi:hypothetical protein